MLKFSAFIGILVIFFGCAPTSSDKLQQIDRKGFSLEYPANWKIDTKDEDYDPDVLFSIDSPDEASIMFVILDYDFDLEHMLKSQVEGMLETSMKKPDTIVSFSSWGHLNGLGKSLKGKLLGVFKGRINIFLHKTGDKTLIIAEQYYDKDAGTVIPQLNHIARSFKFKPSTESSVKERDDSDTVKKDSL